MASKSHLKLPSMVGANQWVNWGPCIKDLHFVFEICCNAFQSMTCEERIVKVHGFLYNSIMRIPSRGQGRSLGMYTSLAECCDHSYRECVLIRAT